CALYLPGETAPGGKTVAGGPTPGTPAPATDQAPARRLPRPPLLPHRPPRTSLLRPAERGHFRSSRGQVETDALVVIGCTTAHTDSDIKPSLPAQGGDVVW